MLADKDHLASMTVDERKAVLDAFIHATLEAVPGARRNSQNANVRPAYVLGIVKDKGQPIQLINAFERPVFASSKSSILETSIQRLKEENAKLKDTWAIQTTEEVVIPDVNVNQFITRLIAHVL
jgi:CRISPR system Cascade subunit CasC